MHAKVGTDPYAIFIMHALTHNKHACLLHKLTRACTCARTRGMYPMASLPENLTPKLEQ